MKEIWDEISIWWKKQPFWKQMLASTFGIALVILLFASPEGMRNLILLSVGFIGWHFLNRRTKAIEQNTRTAQQGLTVEQFTRATEQLANENPSIRLGGIRSLEQIALSHEEERRKIILILSARIREIAPLGPTAKSEERHRRVDIETAVQALAEIAKPLGDEKGLLCDLQETNLSGLRLYGTDLAHFDLTDANVSNTHFLSVNLEETELGGANISNAAFDDAKGYPYETSKKSFYYKGQAPNTLPEGLEPEEREKPTKNDEN